MDGNAGPLLLLLWPVVLLEGLVLLVLGRILFGLDAARRSFLPAAGPDLGSRQPQPPASGGNAAAELRAVLLLPRGYGPGDAPVRWLETIGGRWGVARLVVLAAKVAGNGGYPGVIGDPQQRWARAWHAPSVPYVVLLDQEGRVCAKGVVTTPWDLDHACRMAAMRLDMALGRVE